MHDQSLEQRLRSALQSEGDRIPLTITAAELERRLALRRRSGLSSRASLGLAAVVGIGLLVLVGVAGGWFENRSVVLPSPSTGPSDPGRADRSTAPTVAPTTVPSDLVLLMLPTLDEMIATHDPASIVLAQAFGPADGPGADERPGSRSMEFAAVTSAGSYAVEVACLGSDDVRVAVLEPGLSGVPQGVVFGCDAAPSSRFFDLAEGDQLGIASSGPVSWRIVVEAPIRPALHAATIESFVVPPPSEDLLIDISSETAAPDYGELQTGGGILVPSLVGSVAERESYAVTFTCAGPTPIAYSFASGVDTDGSPATQAPEFSSTQVDCDGAPHRDVIRAPRTGGGQFYLTSDGRDVWRIAVTADVPPIAIAPNEGGWLMSTGFGPNYDSSGRVSEVSLVGSDGNGSARVVVSCFGDQTITGTIDVGPLPGKQLDPFTLDCNVEHPNAVVLTRTYAKAGQVHVAYDPHGSPAWIAITVQVRSQ